MKLAESIMKVVQTASITGMAGSYICVGIVTGGGEFMFIVLVSMIAGLFSSLSLGLMGSRAPQDFEDAGSLRLELKGLKIRAWVGAAIVVGFFLIPEAEAYLD
jgi:hypothetical protein